MSAYYPEPASAGEMLARYRDVKRRLHPPIGPTGGQTMTATEAEAILAFANALTAFMTSRADESERRAAAAAATGQRRPPASAAQKARAAVAAVSSRTGVPVEEIFGRKRIPAVASARHERSGGSAASPTGPSPASDATSPSATTRPLFTRSAAWRTALRATRPYGPT